MNKRGIKRQIRVRRKAKLVSDRPRLTVFRSNKYCYAQIIDANGNALFGLSGQTIQDKKMKLSPVEHAKNLGAAIAKLALEKKIKDVSFDKGSYAYHGRVKAIADGAREAGLNF